MNYDPYRYTFAFGRTRNDVIATRLRVGRSGDRIPPGTRDFLGCKMSVPDLGFTQSPNQWVLRFLPAVKRPGHDVDNALPCSRG